MIDRVGDVLQEAEAAASVQGQLQEFRKAMEADGAAQRSDCRRLVASAVRRANRLVDNVLQVPNVSSGSQQKFLSRTELLKFLCC